MDDVDVVIVGSGACGGLAAKLLTEGGARVLVLEAGPDCTLAAEEPDLLAEVAQPLPPGMREQDLDGMSEATRLALTPGNWRNDIRQVLSIALGWPRPQPRGNLATAEVLARNPRQPVQSLTGLFGPSTNELFIDDVDNPYMTPASMPFYWIRGRVLGGRTQTWQRKAPRLAKHVFESPAREGFGEAWPVTYEDLEPYFEVAEQTLLVAGSVEAGACSYAGAIAARPLSGAESAFREAIETSWPDRRVRVMPYASAYGSEEEDPYATPPSYDNGRRPSHDCSVRCTLGPAAATGRLTLLTGSIARNVTLKAHSDAASGVAYIDAESGRLREVRGRAVLLCASTLESTRILLNSRSERAPEGLGNSSGVLGHYLTDHLFGVGAMAISHKRAEPPTMPPLWIPPFRNTPGDSLDHGFLGGYQVNCAFAGLRAGILHRYRQLITITADGEVLPRFENRVTIDGQVVDRWGIPVLRIEYQRSENEAAMCRDMMAVIEEMMEASGYDIFFRSRDPLPPGMSIHELGTARMGSDRRSSVVNPFCRSWDVPNLYVSDGAVFPSAGSQNPTLTMMAITARACDHILERLARQEL